MAMIVEKYEGFVWISAQFEGDFEVFIHQKAHEENPSTRMGVHGLFESG
jgi:hypothetical protein